MRELENAIEHAFVMCHGTEIGLEHLPPHISANVILRTPDDHSASEKETIVQTLNRYKGNRSLAAAELDMHRSTLWRKMKMLGIAR